MKRKIAQVVVIIIGLMVIAYPLTLGATADLDCRGQTMQPGDTCAKASGDEVQTYEQRINDRQNAKPVIIVFGALITGFGAVLLAAEVRKGRNRAVPITEQERVVENS